MTHTAVAPTAPAAPPPLAVRSRPASARRVVHALAAAALVGLLLPLFGPVPVEADAGASAGATVVSVRPGQTLWEIAEAHVDEDGDVRTLVERIRRTNALGTAPLEAWQRLVVPAAVGPEGSR